LADSNTDDRTVSAQEGATPLPAADAGQPETEATLVWPLGGAPTPSAGTSPLGPPPDSPFGPVELGPPVLPGDEPPAARRTSALPMSSSAQLRRALAAVPEAPPQAVLEARNLTKRFAKREVVRGVSLQVGAGEIVGLLGRNGAGKTTTFRMIMGLLTPDGGEVQYENREITRLPMYVRANRGIGYLAQQPSVFQRMSVEDNLLAVLELQEPARAKRAARVEELIHSLGLEAVRKSMAGVLSGGERRRLEIARAMSLRPRIVLFDEPFSGIDPITVNEIQQILRKLRADGVGILLTDHKVRETLNITDRTYIMDEGQIWIHGPPREIVANEEARERYLGHEFRLDF
jgi:lipopolysaccharide export system ATP-binding protein